MATQTALFYRFGVALFIGMLIGLQREHAYDEEAVDGKPRSFAGVRTFALYGLAGCTAAFASDLMETPWAFIAIMLPLGALIAVAYYLTGRRGEVGMTTEVAAIVTILTGALCYWDQLALAVALGVVITALLSFKFELHTFAEQITREDVVATLKFAIITAIILPLLPNRSYGPPPFDVLNPYNIWLMVVLISGISFLGYILFKILGSRRGIGLTGVLGGLASSTATTLSLSQRSQQTIPLARTFALAIMLAWTVMFARILIVVGFVYVDLLGQVWLPLAAAAGAGLGFTLYLYYRQHGQSEHEDFAIANPFELRPAITFGLLFAVVLLLARTAQLFLGDAGIYLSSFVSGLADVDAITLSMADLSRDGSLELPTAARAIVIAAMANTLVKGGIVLVAGSMALRRAILPGLLLILGCGTVLAFTI